MYTPFLTSLPLSPPQPLPQSSLRRQIPHSPPLGTQLISMFPRVRRNTSQLRWIQANDADDGGELPSVRNLDHPSVLPGSQTLVFEMTDPHAARWEAMSDADARAELLRLLHRRFSEDGRVAEPAAFHMTRWGRSPLTRGAWSAWDMEMSASHIHTLRRPLDAAQADGLEAGACAPRVWLSGEGTCLNFMGFVHGALEAGTRDARHVLHALRRAGPPGTSGCEEEVGLHRARDAWTAQSSPVSLSPSVGP